MKCIKCGEHLQQSDKFCTQCGTPIRTPEINQQNICTKCGINVEKDLKFCTECGTPVSQAIKKDVASRSEFSRPEDSASSSTSSEGVQSPPPCAANSDSHEVATSSPSLIQTTVLETDTQIKAHLKSDSSLEYTSTIRVPDDRLTPSATPDKPHKTTNRMLFIAGGAIILVAVIFYFISSSDNKTSTEPTASEPAPSSSTTRLANDIPKPSPSQSKPASAPHAAESPKQTVQNSKPGNQENNNLTNPTTAPTASEILSFASNHEWRRFQDGIKDRATLPKPPFGDRKTARKLNEEALEALNSDAKKAVALLTQAHSADPGDQEIANNLGFALILSDQYATAEEHLLRILSIWPDRTSIWFNLAQALSLQGNKSQEAIGAFVGTYIISNNQEKTLNYLVQKGNNEDEDALLRSDINYAIEIIKSLDSQFIKK